VTAELHETGEVTVANVPSYRKSQQVAIVVPGHGTIRGDVAWGGNWFFLVDVEGKQLELSRVDELTDFTWQIRQALNSQGIRGDDDQEIDHIELFTSSGRDGIDSRNFVLCPGKSYDRSPCGTGTSAKLACLVADGKLREGDVWRQESIVGSVFEGTVAITNGKVLPRIKGSAHISSEATLILDENDPFCWGIR